LYLAIYYGILISGVTVLHLEGDMINILIVDDNENIRKLIDIHLKKDGYRNHFAENGEEALKIMKSVRIDLVVADIMMPVMDGYELIRNIRDTDKDIPIILVTAKESYLDKSKGFGVGADDYMVKPINFDELRLRVQALLRRAKIYSDSKIVIGGVVIDRESVQVKTPDKTYSLPKKEFFLLLKLLSYPGKTFTRQQLLDEVWGLDAFVDDRTVDVHIKRLRDKFDHLTEFKILTVRGLGYKAEKYK
jgi:two-component system OmpR family response regulator